MNNDSKHEAIPYDPKSAPKVEKRITFSAPATNVPHSTGLATFQNVSNQAVSITVWFDNGARGYSSAVLKSNGDEWPIWVQTGDDYSWALGDQGVPVENQRFWIKYGLNPIG